MWHLDVDHDATCPALARLEQQQTEETAAVPNPLDDVDPADARRDVVACCRAVLHDDPDALGAVLEHADQRAVFGAALALITGWAIVSNPRDPDAALDRMAGLPPRERP